MQNKLTCGSCEWKICRVFEEELPDYTMNPTIRESTIGRGMLPECEKQTIQIKKHFCRMHPWTNRSGCEVHLDDPACPSHQQNASYIGMIDGITQEFLNEAQGKTKTTTTEKSDSNDKR